VWTAIQSCFDATLSLFFPNVCQLCGQHAADHGSGYVCDECRGRPGALRPIRPPYCDRCGLPYEGALSAPFACSNCNDVTLYFSRARSAVVAAGLVREVIHRFKYRRQVWFEPFLVELLSDAFLAAQAPGAWDCLVPVPLHSCREREREFNQARRLAGGFSRRTGIPCRPRLLKRVHATHSQTALSREARAANMRKAFAIGDRFPLNGLRVLLIDDVFTTGATTNACARVLRRAGAAEVGVWTVARGI